MAGLGHQIIGGALTGLGDALVRGAAERRREQLLRLRRKYQVADRAASAALTREGWDRADARAATGREFAADQARLDRDHRERMAAGRGIRAGGGGGSGSGGHMSKNNLVTVVGEDGKPVLMNAANAAGRQPWISPESPVVVKKDPYTGEYKYDYPTQIMQQNHEDSIWQEAQSLVDSAIDEEDSIWPWDDSFGVPKEQHKADLVDKVAQLLTDGKRLTGEHVRLLSQQLVKSRNPSTTEAKKTSRQKVAAPPEKSPSGLPPGKALHKNGQMYWKPYQWPGT